MNIAARAGAPSSFPLCSHPFDDLDHALVHCKVARMVWDSSSWCVDSACIKHHSFLDTLSQVFHSTDLLQSLGFVITSWYLWKACTAAIYVQETIRIHSIGIQAKQSVQQHMSSQRPMVQRPPLSTPSIVNSPAVAANFDGSLLHSKAAIGVIVRDQTGTFLCGLSGKITGCNSNLEFVEALALLHAMRGAHLSHFTHIQFRGDCQSLLKRMDSLTQDFSNTGHTIDLIKQLLFLFKEASFLFVHRDLNKSAYCLASFG